MERYGIKTGQLNHMAKQQTAGEKQQTADGVVWFAETDSTNVQAKAYAEKGSPHGTLFVADAQSNGKGRRGRSWEAPAGCNIYMSLLLRPEIAASAAPMLTLVMAVSVAEAVREVCKAEALIKWPNDIVLHQKKLCGILTEMSAEDSCINYVVIGVGVNVNQEHFSEEIAKKATSIKIEKGIFTEREKLIQAIAEKFWQNYETFLETEDLSGMIETYNRLLVNTGREVRVMEPGNEYTAYAVGVNEKGELLVKTDDGEEKKIFAGEVSVRGIYGYV